MKDEKKNWVVTIRATVTKEIFCDNCTEQQARENPFNHATDERETSQTDWEFESLTPNV